MPDPFAILETPPDSGDDAIRKRYLELTAQFPPERHPEKFAAVRAAYEKIATLEKRAKYLLYERGNEDTLESILEDAECTTPRPRPSLAQLLSILKPAKR